MLQKFFATILKRKSQNKCSIIEAVPYQFEYDKPVPGFDEFTKNLIQHRYDTKRYPNLDEFTSSIADRSRRTEGRDQQAKRKNSRV